LLFLPRFHGFGTNESQPARRVHGGCILERSLRLRQETREQVRLVPEELANVLSALLRVAGFARQAQVTDTAAPASCSWGHMFDLKRDVLRAAVRASTPPLLQQVFADLIAVERALAILDAADLRIVHEVCIEFDEFHADRCEGTEALQAAHPRQYVRYPALQGRREPALRSLAIVEPGMPVARLALSPAPAHATASIEGGFDLLPPVRELGGKHHLTGRIVDESDASCLGARVQFQAKW